MPITFVFVILFFLGVLLLIPAVLASVILLAVGKRCYALLVMTIPVGVIGLSTLSIIAVFGMAELESRTMSARPAHLFTTTFGFRPPPETRVLEAYHKAGLDCAATAMKFRTTPDVIEKIVARGFALSDRATVIQVYRSDSGNLPERVQSWALLPDIEARSADIYMAKTFDKSFARSEAMLWYNEETRIAHVHWVGTD